MKKFLETYDKEDHVILINVDMIRYITVNDNKETVISMRGGSFFTVSETYREIRDMLKNVNV